ncbi:aminoglycoside N(3)-acetyltransferase [Geomicrobium sediminis]|uniref:Aminoglycoside N(3)-acetyltransferase n=1 Tax=Geomicrobium sediminis TaxID=1347788 RepID=A0ABS2PC90_9BACL|nr:AAC(3) family N-acetyltransferase [Geomicrobium sediminis]MBM7633023.1 aminoglycoside 3-N-acetyltransferase [Geomicrobium sediminis]
MGQFDVMKQSKMPQTKTSLVRDLRSLGVSSGMTIIVHSSLKSIGWVVGGAVTVVAALQEVLTEEGTLIMPAHSADVSDPRDWQNPSIPKEWIEEVMIEMPAFDPLRTPTFMMGAIPEAFRTSPHVVRSHHPMHSFSVWGKNSAEVIKHHALNHGLGEVSPLSYIYDQDGFVLMIGTDYGTNTSMHLGEHRADTQQRIIERMSPMMEDGQKVWKDFQELDYDEERFSEIGVKFEETHVVHTGNVGDAASKLFSQRAIVDFTAIELARFEGSDQN